MIGIELTEDCGALVDAGKAERCVNQCHRRQHRAIVATFILTDKQADALVQAVCLPHSRVLGTRYGRSTFLTLNDISADEMRFIIDQAIELKRRHRFR